MRIISNEFEISINEKELSIWMAALRRAAKEHAKYQNGPADSNPFLHQHGVLAHLTGYSTGGHEELIKQLSCISPEPPEKR